MNVIDVDYIAMYVVVIFTTRDCPNDVNVTSGLRHDPTDQMDSLRRFVVERFFRPPAEPDRGEQIEKSNNRIGEQCGNGRHPCPLTEQIPLVPRDVVPPSKRPPNPDDWIHIIQKVFGERTFTA